MFRLVLAGIGAAFVLLVCIQPGVGAGPIAPRLAGQFSFNSHDTIRQFAIAERVAYQRAIEEVYWRHRIWPRSGGERPSLKPSFDAVVSQATIEQKVKNYLRNSEFLEKWQKPLTAEQLQAEMDRMAQHSKQPELLRELFAALGNDPFVIAECLARPVLSDRLVTNLSAHDQESSESRTVTAQEQMPKVNAPATASYRLPTISGHPGECIDEWTSTSTAHAPSARSLHTAVWTGTEMIVWGGSPLPNSGGRYNPSTDSWRAVSTTNSPTGRYFHTAVWTGTEMIVWGGSYVTNYYNTGGRYNPITDTWTATSTINAPLARTQHTAVWSGAEMIVWGGDNSSGYLNSGGRYNPTTDSWTATSTINAPTGRFTHTAVWTGSEMIVFGGQDSGTFSNTGGRYNPSTDTWTTTAMTNAPAPRCLHTAVWADGEMIVFGGSDSRGYLNSGGRYNPSNDSWTATTMIDAPSARREHTAVWTGSEMVVWGGYFEDSSSHYLDTGGRYNPATDSWSATSTTNAPTGRWSHTAVWTGSEMIVWGGGSTMALNTGGGYCGPTQPPIILDARAHRQGGKHLVLLTWSPADGGSVNVLRDGVVINATEDDGEARDRLWNHTGIFTYQVCETDSGDCSNEVTVRVGGTYD